MKLHPIFNQFRYLAPAGEGGESGGAAADRGDDHVPTEEVDDKSAPKADKPAADAKAEEADDKPAPKAGKAGLRADPAAADADEDDGGEEGEDDKPRKDTRIPLKRHQELLNKERQKRTELETQLAQFQRGEHVAAANDKITESEDKLLGLEKDHAKLLEDGKIAEASAKMTEIRKLERGIIEQKSALNIAAAEARAIETVRYDTTLERIEAAYPALNPDNDEFDKDKATEVGELKAALCRSGKTPADALQRAVRYVMGEPATAKQETAVTTTARVDKVAVDAEAAKAAKAAERKEAATKKGIDAALKAPASTVAVGLDSDKAGGGIDAKSVIKMKNEDFAKLDDAVLARLRGDELV